MPDALSAFLSRIGDNPEALFRYAKLSGQLRNHIHKDMRNQSAVFCRQSKNTGHMFFGMTRTCTGACGSRSRNATTCSSS